MGFNPIGATVGAIGDLGSGVAYELSRGRIGSDLTPNGSLMQVGRTQLANATNTPVIGLNTSLPNNDGQLQQLHDAGNAVRQSQPFQQAHPLTTVNAGGGSDYSMQLAQLAAQEGLLRQFLDSDINTQSQQGLSQMTNDANKMKSDLNKSRGDALEDFNMKTNQTTQAKDSALERVGNNARSLRDSVMQTIGRASGSGSSAYQLAAPNAVDRKASLDRTGVLDDFGSNFMALDTAKKRADQDYTNAGTEIDHQLSDRTGSFLRDVEAQKQSAFQGLGDIARQRQAYQGGNAAAIQAAGAPYDAQANQRKAAINDLFNKYNTAYNVAPVQVQNPNLRDYVVDRTAINAGNQAGTPADSTSPYAQFLKQQQDDDKDKLF